MFIQTQGIIIEAAESGYNTNDVIDKTHLLMLKSLQHIYKMDLELHILIINI